MRMLNAHFLQLHISQNFAAAAAAAVCCCSREKRYMATHLPQSSFPGLKREYLFFSSLKASSQ